MFRGQLPWRLTRRLRAIPNLANRLRAIPHLANRLRANTQRTRRLETAVLTAAFAAGATGCALIGTPTLHVDESTIEIAGGSIAVVTLRNPGRGDVDWIASADAGWLLAVPGSGTLGPGGQAELLLHVDRAYRPVSESVPMERNPGVHEARLYLTSDHGDATVDITLIVGAEPSDDACQPFATVDPLAAAGGSDRMAAPADPPGRAAPAPDPSAARWLIVKMREELDPLALRELMAHGFGAASADVNARPGPGRGVVMVAVPAGRDAIAAARALEADPRVVYAEPDLPLAPQVVPNDPFLPTRQWAPCRFGLPAAWDVTTGEGATGSAPARATIAVLDSGVQVEHPDLGPRMLPGYDFCPIGNAAFPGDCSGASPEPGGDNEHDAHGTHVAGIAAAVGDDGVGIAGVAFGGVRIVPVKVFDDAGDTTSVSTVACGIYWAFGSRDPAELCGAAPNPNPAAILNLSLGGPGSSATLDDAVRAAREAGALVFAASGNGSSSSAYRGVYMPANAPGALAIGSVNSNFERSSFSRFDALDAGGVDLVAPGGYRLADGATIWSTVPSGYGYLAGTSMAAPYAAGVAALVWSSDPGLTADEVEARLRGTAYREPGWPAAEYGSGVVCADRAADPGSATICGTIR